MPFEKFEDAEAIDNERRKAIAKSIRIISVEELRNLVKKFSIRQIDHGGKRFFQWSPKIRVPPFTTHQQGRA